MAQDAQLISQAGQVESLASDGLVSVSTGAGQPQKNMELAKFADSLGSSVPLQQTSSQVNITGLYARTSDGKMVELTKESVASVVAGMLSKSYVDNLNEELINGSCGMYSGDTANRPPVDDTYGVWYTHKATYASGSGLFLIQVAMPQIGTEVWMRTCWNNKWKEWKKLG